MSLTPPSAQATYRLIPSSLTNKVWLDRNLGAREVCDQEGSKNAACFGDYYQWGRATDGHENKNSSVITAVQLSSLTQDNGGKFIGEPGNNGTYNHDWTKGDFDEEGHLREAAWADGGVNDICPPFKRYCLCLNTTNTQPRATKTVSVATEKSRSTDSADAQITTLSLLKSLSPQEGSRTTRSEPLSRKKIFFARSW
jgi:hypothetical protein